MSLPRVNLLLKRPAEPAVDARRCKPRAAAPLSEDLAAADALRGLFAASPAAAPSVASSSSLGESERVLQLVRAAPARPHAPIALRAWPARSGAAA